MWYEEISGKKQLVKQPKFPNCCGGGKVQVPMLTEPPDTLKNLLFRADERSNHFIKNIRAYNMIFIFTSMGGMMDTAINKGGTPYVFKLQGANYHIIGSLLPEQRKKPKFCQLYIYDTENEVNNRNTAIRAAATDATSNLDDTIIHDLTHMIDTVNPFAFQFRKARDRLQASNSESVRLSLIQSRTTDGRTHNLQTTSEVAALIVGDIDQSIHGRNIILQTCSGDLQRISELHPCYVPLQYPLLFPYREDGYRIGIQHKDVAACSRKRVKLTMHEFFAFRIHERQNEATTLFHSKRLFQQFIVDAYTMIESERLSYMRNNQSKLRVEKWSDLADVTRIWHT
ncbi:hypothetical protein ACS0TY_035907 [Phlomoides rotata]